MGVAWLLSLDVRGGGTDEDGVGACDGVLVADVGTSESCDCGGRGQRGLGQGFAARLTLIQDMELREKILSSSRILGLNLRSSAALLSPPTTTPLTQLSKPRTMFPAPFVSSR